MTVGNWIKRNWAWFAIFAWALISASVAIWCTHVWGPNDTPKYVLLPWSTLTHLGWFVIAGVDSVKSKWGILKFGALMLFFLVTWMGLFVTAYYTILQ